MTKESHLIVHLEEMRIIFGRLIASIFMCLRKKRKQYAISTTNIYELETGKTVNKTRKLRYDVAPQFSPTGDLLCK
jgi:hypothetical protein